MNGRAGPLPPISPEGSEWSGISKYQPSHDPYSAHHPPGSRRGGGGAGGLATPPISSGSTNGTMNGLSNGAGLGRSSHDAPGNPSPPSSIARSSVGTGMYAGSDSGQSRKGLILQEILSEHYVALKRYLAASLRDEKQNPRPNRARDKLLRLSAVQFQELSTDVFDELLRRQEVQRYQASGAPPEQGPPGFLLPKDTFHPKRNQARQKLSTLPPPRFRDLATDVYYELERRFPSFVGGEIDRVGSPASSMRGVPFGGGGGGGPRPGSRAMSNRGTGQFGRSPPGASPNEYGRPLPKTFQQNTIVPSKGTMVEDDDDQMGPDDDDLSDAFGLEGAAGKRQSRRSTARSTGSSERDKKLIADYQTQVSELQEKLQDMESRVSAKEEELKGLQGSDREKKDLHDLRINLEEKLSDAQELNQTLRTELDRSRTETTNLERDFRSQLESARREVDTSDPQLQSRYQELQSHHENLQVELREQQQITDQVRREAEGFLLEMKTMANGSSDHWEREEQLVHQVTSLEAQVKEWKSRYAKTRTQLRQIRATSIGLDVPDPSKLSKDGGFSRQDGLVKDIHITKFQIAIDDLLRIARTGDPSRATDHMKAVVVAVRHITQDISVATTSNGDQAHVRNRMTTRVSATANNLITATKNFANSGGISPISLLDAAASHLTAAIVELVRIVKIRPTPPGEYAEEEEDDVEDISLPLASESPNFLPIRKAGAISGESVYSPISSPRLSSAARSRSSVNKDSWNRRPASRNGASINGKVLPQKPAGYHHARSHNSDIEELKLYLEDQTENLVQSIQSLVNSIRTDDGLPPIRSHITDIASVVGRVVLATETAIANTSNAALRDRGEPVTRKLADCRSRLLAASAEGEKVRDAAQLKEFAGRLPPLAFEIARETKELVQRIDQVEHETLKEEEEDFR